ncbi:TPA: phage tail spike protein [Streptococcus suis]
MLYLVDKDTKTVKWNGITLHEASSAIVKEETNGDFTLTIRYPITDTGIYQLIKEDMLIKAPSPVLGPQLFRIKKPVENDDSLDITAYHISDDVMQRSITPVSVVGQGCAMALSQMVQNAKTGLGDFSFTSDIMDSRTYNTTETETLYSVLLDGKHSIVGTWEGELVRDNFALSIKRSRGADRGVVITTHKNLKSYQRTKNSQNVVTRIHAKSTFKAENAETDTVLTVTVDSPLIGNYPYINEKEYENNDAKTSDELKKWAEAKFTNEGIDKVSDAIEIEAYELDGQVIHLGDTVNIKSRKHDVDLYKKAIAYEYNALTEEYISITFDDKPGVGGSGISSGVSNAADVILSANRNTQEVAIERAVKNANKAFDAEFEKQKNNLLDNIEQSKAEAELYADNIKQSIDADVNAINQSMQAQSEEHDRQVADILSKTQSVEALANQAKTDAANAITEAIRLDTIERQATEEKVANAKSQAIAEANELVETAKSLLSGQVSSVSTDLSQTKEAIKLLATKATVDALTGRISSAESSLQVQAGEIAQRVKTSDFDQAKQRISTAESSITQLGNRITTEISEVSGKVDKIQFGGRNLLRWSLPTESNLQYFGYFNNGVSVSIEIIDNVQCFKITGGSTAGSVAFFSNNQNFFNLSKDETYVYSFRVKPNVDIPFNFWGFGHTQIVNPSVSGGPGLHQDTERFYSQSTIKANQWQQVYTTFKVISDSFFRAYFLNIPANSVIYITDVMLEHGNRPSGSHNQAPEDFTNEISSIKTTITQTASGVEQLSTSLSTTNNKVTTAETKISQLISDVSSKVSQTDYNTLTGRVSSAESAITQNATEISKRLTSTQVEQAITDKGYATVTALNNKVKETADSFSRTISETKALIPSDATNNNLWIQSRVTGSFTTEILPSGHVTGQNVCYKIFNYGNVIFNIEPDFSSRLYRTVTFSAWVKYENVVRGTNSWNVFNCFKHSLIRKNSSTSAVSSTDYLALAGFTGTSDWKYISYTYDYSANTSYDQLKTNIKFYLESATSGTAWVTGVKIELGSKPTRYNLAVEDTATVTALHAVNDTVDSHTRTIGSVGTTGSILDNVSKVTQTANGLVTEVSGSNGLKTQVSTLAGSYAIKNLTNSGTVLNQLNLNKDGSVRIDGKLVQITGTTYIQDGVISSAKIASLDAGKVTTGTLASARIATNSITGSHISFDQAFFNSFMANEAYLKQVFAKNAFITSVQAVAISASNVTTGKLRAPNGALDINLDNASMVFNQNATINFNSDSNALVRKKGDVTAFVNFTDDPVSGGVYAGIGVTSHNVGVTTASNSDSGKFAGMRVYRPNDSLDLLRLVGDTITIAHGTEGKYFYFKPTQLRNNVDMTKLAGAVYTLSRIFMHLSANGWSFSHPSFIAGVKDEMARNWLQDFANGGLPR